MAPVAVPLKDLKELLDWKAENISKELKKALDKICDIKLLELGPRPQTLLCHDMKGGYTEDRFLEGCADSEAYRFVHWHCIDWFVYFSHSFITIPPPGWTAAAHKNGVPVLGTLITEGPPGEDLCKELFNSLRTVERSVISLISIARHHKLHGWLINIENKIEPGAIGLVVLFLQKLTAAMKTVTSCSRVVWYDSVTHEGVLRWQDQLNGQNSCFYEACDAIFLNYSWTVEKLEASRQYAMTLPYRQLPCISTVTTAAEQPRGGDGKSGDDGENGNGSEEEKSLTATDEADQSSNSIQGPTSRKVVTPSRGDPELGAPPANDASPQHKRLRTSSADALSPSSCAEEATKVFVGVDVFGRNFYEGGGFNCHKALEVIRSLGLSAAIFAAGWTHEVLGCSDFPANDAKFWRLLAPHLHKRGPSQWPLTSSFNEGCGKAFYNKGEVRGLSLWRKCVLLVVLGVSIGGRRW
ncbi:Glycoside hydrolase family 85 [Trinorchestia longiramus]|nr:Glycoside hydrolase family 85 [Trinorchestia longiramus]